MKPGQRMIFNNGSYKVEVKFCAFMKPGWVYVEYNEQFWPVRISDLSTAGRCVLTEIV